jgi:DNA-directed RNA polymerase I subunit RPA49
VGDRKELLTITIEQAVENADNARLIPPHDTSATSPSGAYPLSGIVPESEWNAISTAAILAATDNKQRIALLPSTRNSDYVWQHLKQMFSGPKPKKDDVCVFLFALFLRSHLII